MYIVLMMYVTDTRNIICTKSSVNDNKVLEYYLFDFVNILRRLSHFKLYILYDIIIKVVFLYCSTFLITVKLVVTNCWLNIFI